MQRLYDAAEASLLGNIVQFTPTQKALVEGGGYRNVWIETQPMGGEMYAKRNLEVALNNQIFFLLGQRADGRLPGMVVSGGVNLSGATTQLVFNADSTGAPGAVTAGAGGAGSLSAVEQEAVGALVRLGEQRSEAERKVSVAVARLGRAPTESNEVIAVVFAGGV